MLDLGDLPCRTDAVYHTPIPLPLSDGLDRLLAWESCHQGGLQPYKTPYLRAARTGRDEDPLGATGLPPQRLSRRCGRHGVPYAVVQVYQIE